MHIYNIHTHVFDTCVCVNHLNRYKTSPGFFSGFHHCMQGDLAYNQGPRPTKLWDTELDQLCVPALLNSFSALSFSRPWPPAKPRTGMSNLWVFRWLQLSMTSFSTFSQALQPWLQSN